MGSSISASFILFSSSAVIVVWRPSRTNKKRKKEGHIVETNEFNEMFYGLAHHQNSRVYHDYYTYIYFGDVENRQK